MTQKDKEHQLEDRVNRPLCLSKGHRCFLICKKALHGPLRDTNHDFPSQRSKMRKTLDDLCKLPCQTSLIF
jgi:hypothetical protein